MSGETKRFRITAALVAALAMTGPLPGGAERAAAQETLTLDRALGIATRSNPTYRQAVNNVELNRSEMRTTWVEQILPNANLTLFNTAFTGNLARRATDPFGNPIERDAAPWVYFSSTRQALNLSWNIQGASFLQAYRSQRLANRGRDAAADRAITGLEIAVRRGYMDALEQQDLLRAEEELVDARRVDLAVAQRLFSLAMRTRVDVLNAELAIEQQNLALRQQQAAFEQAKLSLRQALGDEQLGDFTLADEPLPIFDPAGLDAESLVLTALDVNPELRESGLLADQASVGLSRARSSWWPNLALGMSVSRVAQLPETDALFDVTPDEDLESNFYVQLSFPMFNNYFGNRLQIHRAQVDLDNRREAEREGRLRIEGAVRSAVLELSNQFESLRLAERSAEIAQEALRLAREEYRIGSRTFEDLRAAFEQEASTRRQVITARHLFVDALLSLEEAVGVEVGPLGPAGGGR